MANVMVQLQKLANQNTAKTFKFNQEEAKTSRDWQKMMSDTSHQREVADLKKAGLNPVLSANSGAQAYSTQSASGVADSAVNAIGNVESSRTSAAATKYAADKSFAASQAVASAQRYAAAMAYEAQRYHADKAYETQKYHSDKAYQAQIDSKKWDYKIALEKPASNPWGIADKFLSNSQIYGSVRKTLGNSITTATNKFIKNPSNYLNNSKGTITQNNFSLNKQGIKLVNQSLAKMNVANTSFNQKQFIKAFAFNNTKSQRYLQLLMKQSQFRVSATASRWSSRVGSGIW